ncbi:MAG: tetratricopeptide repeat protein [Methylophilaceae bacterium]
MTLENTVLDRQSSLEQAIQFHMNGDLDKAELLYMQLLGQDDNDEEVLYLIGMLACDLGVFDAACQFLQKAVDLSPLFVDATQQLAVALNGCGKPHEALVYYRRALKAEPDNPLALNQCASILIGLDRPEEAEEYVQQALKVSPENAASLMHLGRIALLQDKPAAAEDLFNKSLQHSADDVNCLNWLGLAQLQQDKYADAQRALQKAVTLDPDLAQAHNNLGLAQHRQGELSNAVASFKSALSIDESYVSAKINLANSLRILGQHDAACETLQSVLATHPQSTEALNNLATVYQDMGQTHQALSCLEQASRINPSLPHVKWNTALAQLLLGDYLNGWANFESRWEGCSNLKNAYQKPLNTAWRGEDLSNKTLLLWAEQGFGDTLQFVRFVENLLKLGAKIILEVQKELVGLLQNTFKTTTVIASGETIPAYDYHCPMMSLPFHLGITLENPSNSTPYLMADKKKTAYWRKKLNSTQGKKVGLVWAGSSRGSNIELVVIDARRSLKLSALADILGILGYSFFSLQKGEHSKQIRELGLNDQLIDFSEEWTDFEDTAAFIANLDMVISVDTAVAHLAGALGKETWLLNRHDTCWRWLADRNDSPWYPTLRLFRQPKLGDWDTVISNVAKALKS